MTELTKPHPNFRYLVVLIFLQGILRLHIGINSYWYGS